ncbi:hypothetical protein RMSM_01043 [Rhodopirellula maiorica SM1]|uniref:Uncharacterized protein n=1 Tax=Rhodopirellula maiorica SM1 TaxID=1265738 RepID=M5RRW6_9BACT|nr:hypothetical protein RMSM_01043 [Rhodopirellula maiorica SM1]
MSLTGFATWPLRWAHATPMSVRLHPSATHFVNRFRDPSIISFLALTKVIL